MKYVFTNGNARQRELWSGAVKLLLNLPDTAIPLVSNLAFVPPDEVSKQTTLAQTEWTYGSREGSMLVRNSAPGFGGVDDGLIAEARALGVDWDQTRFYQETSIHELGHAVFAAIGHKFRLAIVALFGLDTDDPDAVYPGDRPWQNRVGEAMAETFKEAFLPAVHRVFPNRTALRIPYSKYPEFRRLFREGLAEIASGGSTFTSATIWVQEDDFMGIYGVPYFIAYNVIDSRQRWRSNPAINPNQEALGLNGWFASPADTHLLHPDVLSQVGLEIPATARALEPGEDWAGWQVVALATSPGTGPAGHWELWREAIEVALARGDGEVHVQVGLSPSYLNLDPIASDELFPFSIQYRGLDIPIFKRSIGANGGRALRDADDVWSEVVNGFPVEHWWNLASGGLDIGDFNWRTSVEFYTHGGQAPAFVQNPDIDFWSSYFTEHSNFKGLAPDVGRIPDTPREMLNWWVYQSVFNGDIKGVTKAAAEGIVGRTFTCHYKMKFHPVWVIGDRSEPAPANVPANLRVGGALGPYEGTVEFVCTGYDEFERWNWRQVEDFQARIEEEAIELPEDAYALGGFLCAHWENDTWSPAEGGSGEQIIDISGMYAAANVNHLLASTSTFTPGEPGTPISIPPGIVTPLGARAGRLSVPRQVTGHRA